MNRYPVVFEGRTEYTRWTEDGDGGVRLAHGTSKELPAGAGGSCGSCGSCGGEIIKQVAIQEQTQQTAEYIGRSVLTATHTEM